MAKKKLQLTEDETVSQSSLAPKGGTSSSGDEEKSVEPSHFSMLSNIMGALANVDRDTLKYFSGQIASHSSAELGKNISDGAAAGNRDTLKMHASDALGGSSPRGTPGKFGDPDGTGSEDGITSRKPSQFGHPDPNESIKQEVSKLFTEEDGLTDEFKTKAVVIFEAAVGAKVALATAKLSDQYEEALSEAIEQIAEEMEEKVATYIEYVADEWMKTNEVAIESSLRNEAATELFVKIRDAFKECNVNIPEDQVDVVDTLAGKVDELEGRLAEAIQEITELRKVKETVDKDKVVAEAAKGLKLADAEKLCTLAEGIDENDIEEFTRKVAILRESIKPNKKSTVATLLEEIDEDNKTLVEDDKSHGVDPQMKRYLQAIDGMDPNKANRV